jgi:hypothetical protein
MGFLNNILEIKKQDISNNLANEKIINTKINIDNIEDIINNFLDKHNEILKYYLFIDEKKWCVSFNLGLNQYDAMIKTMFEIKIYKDVNNKAILFISKEIDEHEKWTEIYNELITHIKDLK